MTDNGLTGKPGVIEQETMSGVIVQVTPLSIFTLEAIRVKAETLFPYPDKTDYRLPLENAAPGVTLPAEDNPEYQALCKAVDNQRWEHEQAACLDLACAYPQFSDRAAMLDHFAPRLAQIAEYAALPEDKWRAVLEHCVFTGTASLPKYSGTGERAGFEQTSERILFVLIARQNAAIPLTAAEVRESFRVYRPDLQFLTRRPLARPARSVPIRHPDTGDESASGSTDVPIDGR